MTLTEFLSARLDEDEAAARAVVPLGYNIDMGGNRQDELFTHGRTGYASEDGMPRRLPDGGAFAHFARHDPARVLREVEAKRAIVAGAAWVDARSASDDLLGMASDSGADGQRDTLDWVLRHLAAVYSDHPAYQAEWKP